MPHKGDPQFVLTLPDLERLYLLNHGPLVHAVHTFAASADPRDAVQSAFAHAARTRFGFRSERHVLAWLREQLGLPAGRSLGLPPRGAPRSDWADVLQRARIAIERAENHRTD